MKRANCLSIKQVDNHLASYIEYLNIKIKNNEMKKITTLFIVTIALFFCSCDSYLDRQPDEALTSEAIFKKYATTLKYLINVYSWIPDESDNSGQQNPWEGSSDECSVAYTSRAFGLINQCTWSPSSDIHTTNVYKDMYKGIREASYFMQHVHQCPTSELSETDATQWYAEARFMRAYYYFSLMKVFGPIFLLGDEPIDFTDPNISHRERNTWNECVKYVSDELDSCVTDLPEEQPANMYGRATRGAAMAVKARLLLYSARPLFNGNPMYKTVMTADGTHLFPETYDENKWKLAAAAAKDIIDLNHYELIGENDGTPYVSLKKVFIQRCNNELIFTAESYARNWRITATPRYKFNGYGGVGVTQKLVDAFAMKTGRYPITGYTDNGATPIIDNTSGYSETGFSTFVNPLYNSSLNTFRMYQNREPRFYVNVFWSGMTWTGGTSSQADIQFFYNGNSGPGNSHNYTTTGYLPQKFRDVSLDSKSTTGVNAWSYFSWPLFRFAEVLLNYAEALNEYDPTNPDIITALNRVRKRAGVPNIESVYPEAVNDKILMRELIHRERMIELCFENQRYFDTRTWKIAETEDNGPVYGMNILNTNHTANGNFWKRTIIESDGGYPGIRIFRDKCYLFPIPQDEIDRVKCTQNYGW